MKKLFLATISLLLVFGLTFAFSQEAAQKKASAKKAEPAKVEQKQKSETKADVKKEANKKAGKPLKGRVISLAKYIIDNNGTVSKDEAMKEADEGKPIVFLVGEGKKAKIYFVFNEDGSFAGKKLAKYASNKYVGIIGKQKVVGGLNIIIAEMIESMD
jgi:hypothetical protein